MKKISKTVLKKREKRRVKRENKKLWIELKKEIIIIQNNKCYLCGRKISKRKNKIDLHHIIDKRIKILAYDKSNLVGLCKRCHRLAPEAVHQSSIYFSDILRNKEPKRYYYLLEKIKNQKGGEKMKRKPTAWNKHVSSVQKSNPKMKFSEVLKKAKKTYKKVL